MNYNCYKCLQEFKDGETILWVHGSRYHTSCYNEIHGWNDPVLVYSSPTSGHCFRISKKNLPKVRDNWDVYFIKQADSASTRATCDRKHCGAIVTKNNRIYGTGYNGSGSGDPHCDDVGHFIVNGHCVRTIHAEINAILDAREKLSSLEGCKIYINTYPCWSCFGRIAKEGIKEIFYKDEYRNDEMIEKAASFFGIKITKVAI